jgi:hypothetical protein
MSANEPHTTDSVSRITLTDEEKQQAQSPNTDGKFLVEWDGDGDPLNPRSFSLARKWLIIFIVSFGSLLVYVPPVIRPHCSHVLILFLQNMCLVYICFNL